MLRFALIVTALLLTPALARADAVFTRLLDLLAIDAYVAIAREEGLADAGDLARDMMGREADPGFLAQLEAIYDKGRLKETVAAHLQARLSSRDVEAAVAFFSGDPGLELTALEVAARRAMSDPEIEEAARDAWEGASLADPERVVLVDALVEVNDLIERNVAGALNSSLRFFEGLADGGALSMGQQDMIADVWSREQEFRDESAEWLGGFLYLAYQPLEDEALRAYLDFWKTPAGAAVNAAVFEGFNLIYDEISYATGRIVALNVQSEEL